MLDHAELRRPLSGYSRAEVQVNPTNRTVGVKLSSWREAQNATYLVDTLRAFGSVCGQLGSREASLTLG